MSRIFPVVAFLSFTIPLASGCPEHPDEGLDRSVRVVPRETLPWLPLSVTVTVENRTAEELPYYPFSLSGGLAVWIEPAEGGLRSFSGAVDSGGFALTKPLRLQPGERYARKVWIFCDKEQKRHSIPQPGRYVVGGTVGFEKGRRPSVDLEKTTLPPTEIQVHAPRGRDEEVSRLFAETTSWMHSDPEAWGLVPSKDILEQLTKVGVEYGDTIYGKYARFMLARHYGSRRKIESARKDEGERAADLRRAVEILEQLDSDGPPENLVDEVRLKLGLYYLVLEERDRARTWVQRVQGDGLPEPLRSEHRGLTQRLSK